MLIGKRNHLTPPPPSSLDSWHIQAHGSHVCESMHPWLPCVVKGCGGPLSCPMLVSVVGERYKPVVGCSGFQDGGCQTILGMSLG